ncbi:MAG TPA: hypothetical protein VMQ83_00425 [Gammaproteobacteria bacterium]|nr:hypothetical protein [Gammaproteobacteria bacterium]
MIHMNAARQGWRAAVLLTCAGLLAAPAGAAPPVLDIVGGNSANGNLLWLDFDNGVAETVNTDANERVSLRSFYFFKNTCGGVSLDVIAADTNSGTLIRYPSGQGTGTDVCVNGACPARPDGLSSSNERLMAVAEIGTAGQLPAVWFLRPAACGSNNGAPAGGPFEPGVQTGQFKVGSGGAATPVGGIADTEFVRVPGGGLAAGDSLVLTINPTTIARIRRADIKALLDSGGSVKPTDIDIVVDQSFFGTEKPTGLAFVPGTAGIGAVDTASESEDLLVTLAGGRVLKLTFELSGSSVALKPTSQPGATPLEQRVFISGLGNGPLGVAAGTRRDNTYAVIADRQQGTFYRYGLHVNPDGGLCLRAPRPGFEPTAQVPCDDGGTLDRASVTSGVQNAYGAAINSDAYAANECSRSSGGCQIRKTVELLFSEEILSEDQTVFANIYVINDPRSSSSETLNLNHAIPGVFDPRFTIPATCRGFKVPDDPSTSILLVLDIKKSFDILQGEFAQAKETVEQIIPEFSGCETTGARLFHHPDPGINGNFVAPAPENGVLRDATFFCSNPSRSITPTFSPLVFCEESLYQEVRASGGRLKGKLAKAAEEGINLRIDSLQQVINALPATLPSTHCKTLKADLTGFLNAASKDIKRNIGSVYQQFDNGAKSVFACRSDIAGLPVVSGRPATLYSDLLARFMAAAFYSRETIFGGQHKYCPLVELLTGSNAVIIPNDDLISAGCPVP